MFQDLDIVPKHIEESMLMFNQVIRSGLTHALLAGIRLFMIDLSLLAYAVTWQFIILSLTSVISMMLVS